MLIMGAVAYDPKVVTIWEGFRAWFQDRGLDFDYVLFSHYERQVDALLAGQIQAAWHSPLAWVQTRRADPTRARALVMRDTDQDLASYVVVREGFSGSVADLRRVGVGAWDSPQATILPRLLLAEAGFEGELVRHDVLVGKHGDHVGGERDAARALMRGEVDAACVLDGNYLGFGQDGTWPADKVRVLARTPRYDHCNMTVLEDTAEIRHFGELLLSMAWDDPVVRPLLQLEGLKRWLPGRTRGYELLERAVDRFGDPWLDKRLE